MKKQLVVIVFLLFGSFNSIGMQNKNINLIRIAQPKKQYRPISLKADSLKKVNNAILEARPFPLPEPNLKEIKFYHRYWRDIDLRDKRNQVFIRPGATLIEALVKGLKDGKITAYDPMGGTPENPAGDAFN